MFFSLMVVWPNFINDSPHWTSFISHYNHDICHFQHLKQVHRKCQSNNFMIITWRRYFASAFLTSWIISHSTFRIRNHLVGFSFDGCPSTHENVEGSKLKKHLWEFDKKHHVLHCIILGQNSKVHALKSSMNNI